MTKRENGCREEQYAPMIMGFFKDHDNDRLRELCSENYCEVAIVPYNLINKFQPLDISVNKVAKTFIQNITSGKMSSITSDFQMKSQHS